MGKRVREMRERERKNRQGSGGNRKKERQGKKQRVRGVEICGLEERKKVGKLRDREIEWWGRWISSERQGEEGGERVGGF